MIEYVDIIFGAQWGDEGKGKISNAISKNYDIVCRWNGGPNAGHTVYINEKKYKTHIIPCGVFQNKLSIIGPNCVLNVDKFYDEIAYLKKEGFNTSLIKVSPKAHIITDRHLIYDKMHLKEIFGTTGQGIAPAYSDKMLRVGKLAKDYIDKQYIWDGNLYGKILCEGAQSFWLDINYGNYPYITSSTTLPYGACCLGFPPQKIRKIYGAAKIYDTRAGTDPDFPEELLENVELRQIILEGKEYGTTTGRMRKVNWLNLDKLITAINVSGCTDLIISKVDVLEKLGFYKLYYNNNLIEFNNMNDMKNYIIENLNNKCTLLDNITFSSSVENI
jgi:adenylosuccinate synthase